MARAIRFIKLTSAIVICSVISCQLAVAYASRIQSNQDDSQVPAPGERSVIIQNRRQLLKTDTRHQHTALRIPRHAPAPHASTVLSSGHATKQSRTTSSQTVSEGKQSNALSPAYPFTVPSTHPPARAKSLPMSPGASKLNQALKTLIASAPSADGSTRARVKRAKSRTRQRSTPSQVAAAPLPEATLEPGSLVNQDSQHSASAAAAIPPIAEQESPLTDLFAGAPLDHEASVEMNAYQAGAPPAIDAEFDEEEDDTLGQDPSQESASGPASDIVTLFSLEALAAGVPMADILSLYSLETAAQIAPLLYSLQERLVAAGGPATADSVEDDPAASPGDSEDEQIDTLLRQAPPWLAIDPLDFDAAPAASPKGLHDERTDVLPPTATAGIALGPLIVEGVSESSLGRLYAAMQNAAQTAAEKVPADVDLSTLHMEAKQYAKVLKALGTPMLGLAACGGADAKWLNSTQTPGCLEFCPGTPGQGFRMCCSSGDDVCIVKPSLQFPLGLCYVCSAEGPASGPSTSPMDSATAEEDQEQNDAAPSPSESEEP
eukprot:jgi/Botrbrau1/9528/Bobra.0211s0019.1